MYDESTMSSANAAKSMIESLREVVQDLLVPELKSVKVSIDSLRSEMVLRDEKLEQFIKLGLENQASAIRHLSEKLDFAIDIRERLALS
jgi:ribulose kinase